MYKPADINSTIGINSTVGIIGPNSTVGTIGTKNTTGINSINSIKGVDELAACWAHDGEAADMVRALKYGRMTSLVTPIAEQLAGVAPDADLVTWVPCSPSHRQQRGFDPAELLARAVARRLGLKTRRTLRRLDDQPQTSRDRAGRIAGPRLRAADGTVAGRVLLVDDVCTTGSTLRVAAAALRGCGASAVVVAVATVALPLP